MRQETDVIKTECTSTNVTVVLKQTNQPLKEELNVKLTPCLTNTDCSQTLL